MSELSYRRWVALVLGVIVSVGGCAKTSDVHGQGREAGPSGEPILKKDVAGRTYTNAPAEARLGLHRFMIPANYFNDQVGPSPDIGLELTLFWPTLDAAPPGNYPVRTADEQYRQVSATVVPIDRIPIESVLDRMVTTDGTTEAGSLRRRDPRARLELRARQPEVFGLSPYVIDEVRMPPFAAEYEATYGQQLLRNPDGEKDWYIARSTDGALVTFIACSSQRLRQDGLLLSGDQVTPDGSGRAAMCSHHFVDAQKRIAFDVSYPRVLLKDWRRMEDAMRGVMDRYQVN